MSTQIKLRRDSAANWTANNPTLAEGEVAYELDTGKLKVGDGINAWNTLTYFTGAGAAITDVLGGAGLTASGTGVITLNVGAGTGITVNADDIAVNMGAFTTDNLAEGITNKYFANELVDDRVAALLQNGGGVSWTYNDVANTLTPSVSLAGFSTTDLAEGTNLYYTQARFDSALAGKTADNLAEGVTNKYFTTANFSSEFATKNTDNLAQGITNKYYATSLFNTDFAAKSTTDLSEGTNLYYTQARFDSALAAKTTTNLAEGTNLYYTDGRFDTRLATKTTTDLAEGTNLYFTNERVDDRVSALIQNGTSITWSYDDVSNTLTPTVTVTSDDVVMQNLAGATYTTVQQMQDVYHSTGLVTGGAITDGGAGTVNVAAGQGYLRATSSVTGTLYAVSFGAATGLALTDNAFNYIYVYWNAGTPAVMATVTEQNTSEYMKLGTVYREGTTLHITEASAFYVGDHAANMIKRLQKTAPFARASGGILSEAGTRGVAITPGVYWEGLNEVTLAAFDSTGVDTFDTYHRNGVGGWTKTAGVSQLGNTQYDNGTGTLATLASNQYGIYWVYEDHEREVAILYGQGSYTLSEAQLANPPASVPPYFKEHSILTGRIIFKKDAVNFTEVDSAFTKAFTASAVSNHNDLGSIQGGAADDYNHLTTAQVALVNNAIQPGDAITLQKFNETIVAAGSGGGAVSFDMNSGSIHTITLTSNITSLALTNATAGASATIIVTQDATGGRTLTAGASWKWAGGTKTLSTAANAVDIISVVWDGTTYWASLTTDYQ